MSVRGEVWCIGALYLCPREIAHEQGGQGGPHTRHRPPPKKQTYMMHDVSPYSVVPSHACMML